VEMRDGWQPDPFGIHSERLIAEGKPTALVRDDGIGSLDEPPATHWPSGGIGTDGVGTLSLTGSAQDSNMLALGNAHDRSATIPSSLSTPPPQVVEPATRDVMTQMAPPPPLADPAPPSSVAPGASPAPPPPQTDPLPPPPPPGVGGGPQWQVRGGQSAPFTIVNVLAHGTQPSYMFPGPGPEPNTLLLEPDDGSQCYAQVATALSVTAAIGGGKSSSLISLRKTTASILISSCRVGLACSAYDKGGGWVPFGGIASGAIALTANAVSRSMAKKRRTGNMMVGHVRYPWLLSVGYAEGHGIVSSKLRLSMSLPQAGQAPILLLTLELQPSMSIRELTSDIVRRAALYRLAHGGESMSTDARERHEYLATGPGLEPIPGKFATYFFNQGGSASGSQGR